MEENVEEWILGNIYGITGVVAVVHAFGTTTWKFWKIAQAQQCDF